MVKFSTFCTCDLQTGGSYGNPILQQMLCTGRYDPVDHVLHTRNRRCLAPACS